MTEDNDKGIGVRLRSLRTAKGLTLDRLAGLCGLTRGYLSLVERGLKTPSIAALMRVTEALGTDLGSLFDGPRGATLDYVLYRHGADTDTAFGGAVPMAPGRTAKMMEPFITRPGLTEVAGATHSGEEFIVVLRGEVIIRLGSEEIRLHFGDSLYFDASIPHSIRRFGVTPAELLIVVGRAGGAADTGQGPGRR
jgi:mannose-6-phosphate isomerase-like protein (cupin superfamily)